MLNWQIALVLFFLMSLLGLRLELRIYGTWLGSLLHTVNVPVAFCASTWLLYVSNHHLLEELLWM